jgi:hypothetical protein
VPLFLKLIGKKGHFTRACSLFSPMMINSLKAATKALFIELIGP